jgi:hypothetical protein
MKKIKVNILDVKICNLSCHCGANITLGFESKDWIEFVKLFPKFEFKDLRTNKQKINQPFQI